MKIKILILPLILFCINIAQQEINASDYDNAQELKMQFLHGISYDYALCMQIMEDAESHPGKKSIIINNAIKNLGLSIDAAKTLTKDEFIQYKYIFESMLKAFDHATNEKGETKEFDQLKIKLQKLLEQQKKPVRIVGAGAGAGMHAMNDQIAIDDAALDTTGAESAKKDNAAALASANAKATALFHGINKEYKDADLSILDEEAQLQIMQSQSNSKPGENCILQNPLSKIQSINDFIQNANPHMQANRRLATYQNIMGYTSIMNVRGDGNCGFRSFLLGTFITSIQSQDVTNIDKIIQLIDVHYTHLFHNNSSYGFSPAEINASKDYVLKLLREIKSKKSAEEINILYNKNIPFDVYMILFLRMLLANSILENNLLDIVTVDEIWINFRNHNNLTDDDYTSVLTQWALFDIDQVELSSLQTATNIPFTIISLKQGYATTQYPDSIMHNINKEASIVNTGGHYQVLIP